jgi:predicted amidohydrolase YtcJ
VAPPIPLQGIYAAVTRSTLDGKNPNGWVPSQKIDVFQSLKAYTSHANYAAFQENIKGRDFESNKIDKENESEKKNREKE